MEHLKDNIFIYGSFDFKAKGLGFAYTGDLIKDDHKIFIRKMIEKIGNYGGDKNKVRWLVQKVHSIYVIMGFSFGGKDEHGRSTFISKGIILNEEEYEKFDFSPFLLLPYIDLNYQVLKKEIINGELALKDIELTYNLIKIYDTIKQDTSNIRKYCISIWSNSKITFPQTDSYLKILEAIYVVSKLKFRKNISFITCDSIGVNDVSVRFQEGLSSPKFAIIQHKLFSKSFSTISEIISTNDEGQYLDFIFEQGEFRPKTIWESLKNLNIKS